MQSINPILSLRVARFNDEPVAEPFTVEFGPAGGTIGRATDCTLVLPDQQRAISRVHARVECRGGEFLLCDMGANASLLNQRAIGGTREARLADGDRVQIGAYLLEVVVGERAAGTAGMPGGRDPLAAAKVLGGPLPDGADGGAFGLGLGLLDPLGQPGMGRQAPVSTRPAFEGSQSDHVPPEFEAFSVPGPAAQPAGVAQPASAPAGGIPADYDPLADALAQWDAHAEHAVRAGAAGVPVAPASLPVQQGGSLGLPSSVFDEPATGGASASLPVKQGGSLGLPSSVFDEPVTGGASASLPVQQGGPTGLPSSLLGEPMTGGATTPFDDLFAPAPAQPPLRSAEALSSTWSQPQPLPEQPQPAPQSRVQPPSQRQVDASSQPERQPLASWQSEPASQPPSDLRSPSPFAPLVADPAAQQPPAASGSTVAASVASSAASSAASTATSAATSSTTSSTTSSAASSATEPDAVLAALIAGLGLDPTRTPNLPPAEFARLVGAMLREALSGTMTVLRSRSSTKREARLDTTVIVARDNNPLKFFPDVDSALAQMLTGRSAGYLPPDQALEQAFVDIQSHELAMIAGMRAALGQVLARFDPAALDTQLTEQGVMDKILSNRKAKLWDRFVAMQAQIAREGEDDFQKLFGTAFNDAYETQIDALRAARTHRKPDPAGNG